MAKRPNIDPAVKEIILRMSTVDPSLTIQRISELVGVHPSSVHRVRKLYKETGKLVKTSERLGRKPALTDADIEVRARPNKHLRSAADDPHYRPFELQCISSWIAEEPELSLYGLRDRLATERNRKVSLATVSRTEAVRFLARIEEGTFMGQRAPSCWN